MHRNLYKKTTDSIHADGSFVICLDNTIKTQCSLIVLSKQISDFQLFGLILASRLSYGGSGIRNTQMGVG